MIQLAKNLKAWIQWSLPLHRHRDAKATTLLWKADEWTEEQNHYMLLSLHSNSTPAGFHRTTGHTFRSGKRNIWPLSTGSPNPSTHTSPDLMYLRCSLHGRLQCSANGSTAPKGVKLPYGVGHGAIYQKRKDHPRAEGNPLVVQNWHWGTFDTPLLPTQH